MITHNTTPPMMIAVRILRARVGASSRLNQPIQSGINRSCFEKRRAHEIISAKADL